MKITLILIALIAVVSSLDAEPVLSDQFPITPQHRCIQAYQNTDNIVLCENL